MAFEVIFENDDVVVVDKPVNWLTTPARDAADPRPVLGREVQSGLGLQVYPVHRLDFEVGGLVMFAKTVAAHRAMQAWFEIGSVRKTYEAFSSVGGTWPVEWTEWSSKLAKGKRRAFRAGHGKPSVTRARARAEGERLRWELQPLTGRPHQLRFELADRGWPILGDVLYGGEALEPLRGIALRACVLDFTDVGQRFGLPVTLTGAPLN